MFQKALEERNSRIKNADNWSDFMSELNSRNLVNTPWCDVQQCEKDVKEKSKEESKAAENEGEELLTGSAKTLCKPLDQEQLSDTAVCFHCGEKATTRVIWGRSY